MARKKDEKHKEEVLIGIVERFLAEKDPYKRPKYSQIGEFARSIGYDIGNHIFQKSPEVRQYLDNVFDAKSAKDRLSVAVYDTLDTERFIAINNTPQKMKNALHERDMYYRQVVLSAGKAFEENDDLEKKNADLNEENRALKNENSKLHEELDTLKKEKRSLSDKEKKLRDIIKTWVYPEIANELLKKEGLLKDTEDIIKPEVLEEKIFTGSSDINGLIKTMFKKVETI